jgi:hypothetical protein
VLNLAIGAVKAALVLLFFMRLRTSGALVRLAALAGFATLAILFALAGSDYATRTLYRAPLQAPRRLRRWRYREAGLRRPAWYSLGITIGIRRHTLWAGSTPRHLAISVR